MKENIRFNYLTTIVEYLFQGRLINEVRKREIQAAISLSRETYRTQFNTPMLSRNIVTFFT